MASSYAGIELRLNESGPELPWSSKVGGHPYLVNPGEHPLDSIGNPLAFVAQLNFTDLPPVPGYPVEGLLQFFVSTSVVRPFEHRVVYHALVPHEWVRQDRPLPVRQTTPMPLGPDGWPSPWGDDDANPIQDPDREYGLVGESMERTSPHRRGHRVGGEPFSIQGHELPAEHVLLLQLDSDPHEYSPDGYRILWGDLGTGRFSVHPKHLAQQNFLRTHFRWDNA